VTTDAGDLLAQEEAAWVGFERVVHAVGDRLEEPGLTPDGWTVKDVIVHVGGWLDDCGAVLESLAAGTWDPSARPAETVERLARVNAGHVALAREMSVGQARAFVDTARARARTALSALDRVNAEAWSWFEEAGPMHYAKHGHDLAAWLAGVPSDPRVDPLLQIEAEEWVSFMDVLEGLAPTATLPDPAGWTAHDVAFHVTMWLEVSAADLEANRGWAHDDDPGEADLVDAMNDRWRAEGRGLAPDVVRTRLSRARARLRAALAALPSPSDQALGWFEANTSEHYAEHLPHLRLAGRQGRGG
jgi:hypothetical protein